MTLRKTLYISLYFLFLLSSCAKQTSPTGGPKDTIPPILIKAYPQKQQINFTDKKVELTFNEVVALANPKEQIMITPDVGKEFDITSSKKKVILQFKNKLSDSTTYSINYRDAIQDITEKNPAINLKVAFSTGPYIDSLSISGYVYDLIKDKELKEATIALYQSDTFNIFKHKPIYITKSDPKGRFIIENLKPGNYFIYAFDDKSRNLIVDSKNEPYGFLSDTLKLNANLKGISIPLSKLDARVLKLTSIRPYNTYFNIKTSKNLSDYNLKSIEGDTIISSFGDDMANIKIFNTLSKKDSAAVRLHAIDSTNNSIDTTFYIKFSTREVKPEPFTVSKETFRIIESKGTITGKIKFTKPIASINFDSILYKVDSIKIITFSKENFTLDNKHKTLLVEKKFDRNILAEPKQEDKAKPEPQQPPPPKPTAEKQSLLKKTISHQLSFGKGSFISIEGDSSKTIEENIKPLRFEDTGILLTEAKTTEANYILQLLDKTFNVLQSIPNTRKVSFEDLSPGDYMIRLVIDKNGDQKWTPGNFFTKQEDEPIRYYKNEKGVQLINLKANWEVDQLLITY